MRKALEQNTDGPALPTFTPFPPASGEGDEHVVPQGISQGTTETLVLKSLWASCLAEL